MNQLQQRALEGFRRSRRARFGTPEIVLALLILVSEFILFPGNLSAMSLISGSFGIALVVAAPRWPALMAVLSIVLLVVSSATSADATPHSLFITVLVIEIITAGGLITLGLTLVLVVTAVSTVDFASMRFQTDPMSIMITLAFLGAGFLVGWNRLLQTMNNARLRRSLADSQRDHRVILARELHDSVATSLTGVVMRSQALELSVTDEEDRAVKEGLEDISRSSRDALEQLRTMLRLLSSESELDGLDSQEEPPGIRVALDTATRELRAYGLRVRSRIALPRTGEPEIDRRALSRILIEMTSNAAKHSPPRGEVTISCRVNDGQPGDGGYGSVTVIMTNPVAPTTDTVDDQLMSSHLGLGSMIARAHAAGGELIAESVPSEPENSSSPLWQTAVTLPIIKSVR